MHMTNKTTRSRSRSGFSLIELLVGIVIFAIIGALFTRLMTTQGRFYDRQGMANAARNVSRASLNRVVSDFRMIEATGGVVAASPTSLTINVPYAIGIDCGDAANSVLTLLPVDPTTYQNAGFFGYAWRNAFTGAYTYVTAGTSLAQGDPGGVCAASLVTTVPGGQLVSVAPALPAGTGLGTPVFLFSRVRYEFKASVLVPGKLGLFRTGIAANGGQSEEELVAPFANTAKWKFFTVAGGMVPQDAAPADLTTIRGLELHFDGTSESIAVTKSAPETANFTTAVWFKNRTN
jgi:prepilin-type N-terminal cleavage/methylation domain-containing protein